MAYNRVPYRIEYRDVNGTLKWTEQFMDPSLGPIAIIALRAAGATDFAMFHDNVVSNTPGASYSKYPGANTNTLRGLSRWRR